MRNVNLKKLLSEAKNRNERRTIVFLMVKLGFNRLNPSNKVKLAHHVISKMTGNPNFAAPNPSLATLTIAANALQNAEAALDGSKVKTIARNTAEIELDKRMRQMQSYVMMAANGNKEIMLSSGMQLRSARTAVGLLGPVTDIAIKIGKFPGSVDMSWKGFKRSRLYQVEACTDPLQTESWLTVGSTTKQRITISQLESGVVYYFRIVCSSSAGKGPFTAAYSIKVY